MGNTVQTPVNPAFQAAPADQADTLVSVARAAMLQAGVTADQLAATEQILRANQATPTPHTPESDPCERFTWCTREAGHPEGCTGPIVRQRGTGSSVILSAEIGADAHGGPELVFDTDGGTPQIVTAAALRAYAERTRLHLARLDALADQYDAITETKAVRHYPWCAGHCETEQYDDGTITTAHYGAETDLPVPEDMHPADGVLLRAGIGADESCCDPTPALFLQSGGEGTTLNAAGTDQLIADLDAFTARLRALRAQMEQGPQA